MTFYEVLEQALVLLHRHKRISYRALKLQFPLLGDESLEALKDELIYQRIARDEDGKGLVWTGEPLLAFEPPASVAAQGATSDTAAITPSGEHVQLPSLPPTTSPSDLQGAKPESVRSAPEAERRQLTVMFCDLADSTKLSQQLDPEDLREVVRAYQATAAKVIQQYEGYMAQYLGDGLLIYFGWPAAHEDDAPRALHTGLGIVEAITTSLNPRLERGKGVQVAVRIGIHTGPVVVGEMGGGDRHEHLATGDTVNIASRLEGVAAPNTVVISNVTARLVRGAFALEDLGRHTLKGVAAPMQVVRVLGPMEGHEDETVPAGIPFLVGRNEEMGLLLRRWEQSKEGLGQAVLVSGEAGIGKSSLVEAVRTRVRQEGLPRIAFRCSSYHRNSALYPVIVHVERLLAFDRDDAPTTKLDKLEQGLRTYSLPLEDVVPLFAALLSVPLDHHRYPAPTLTPQQQKQQTLDALVAWMLEAAERQPVLVAWEDLHWADPSTLEMLGLVLEQTPTVPMLHVLTFRPEFVPPWPSRSHMTPMTLNRLERPQVEALITHLAAGKTLPAEVVEHIVAKTDGVPLYVEELTKMLLGSELLLEETDEYVLTGPLLSVAIPDTLQDSLMARLDQLSTAKEVAQLGAVLGREFAYELLQIVSPQDDETLQAGLTQLVEAELLYQRGRPPRAKYIFKHALIQDAAYASLLRSTRQRYHQQIAQQSEARFSETVEMQPELVAYHYTEAGCPEQAIRYWQQAGQRALQRSANEEAISHLTKGLDLLSTLPDTRERSQQELEILMILGPALIATKGFGAPEVEATYTRARELSQHVGDPSEQFQAMMGLWNWYFLQAYLDQALVLGKSLLSLAQETGNPSLLVGAYRALGSTLLFCGESDTAHEQLEHGTMFRDFEQRRVLALRYGADPALLCHVYSAWSLWHRGYFDQARHQMTEALSLAHKLGHPHSLALASALMAMGHQLHRETQTACEHAKTALALAAEHGFTQVLAISTMVQGWAISVLGQTADGIARVQEGLISAQTIGTKLARPYFLTLLTESHVRGGQVEEGLHILAEGLALVDTTGERWYEAELHRLKGELLLQQAIPDAYQAEICFQQALDIARRQQAKSLELRAATSLARLWQSQGKRQDAYDLLAPVYGWFTEGFDTADLQEAKSLLDALRE